MAAWLIALAATMAALFIGEVMGMTPCVLCWYQRILMFPLAVILALAAFSSDRRGATYAMPFALGGLLMSLYHSALVSGWVAQSLVPCGTGPSCSQQNLEILGGVQIPWLAFAAFLAITTLLIVYLRKSRT